ncbi:hypothetical protein [Chitinophaga sp. HK235]|uniref:hypothetical protein n=1 Tax=Chitinophaga sp. HK235 TaxID=2952571 RepID=UPI001BA88154|nr:hypothetical protein [Chitinophaga sp. HK235]
MKIEQVIYLFCCFQLLFFPLKAQKRDSCDCYVLMNPDFKGKVGLYDKKGNLTKYLKQNFKDEDFIVFQVLEDSDSLFNVLAMYSIAGNIAKGWVKKSDVIGTYLASYGGNIAIYDEPDKKSKKKIIPDWTNRLVAVSACKSKWVKISLLQKGKKYIGWLPPESQCADAYSTCN